jgi:hypothetical protein
MSLGSLLLIVSCVRVDGFAVGFLPREYILRSYIIVFISADTDFLFILAKLCDLR